jgi:flavin reductase (DIM6/NTAB) family NADH-FMN oxidoreductase RutF
VTAALSPAELRSVFAAFPTGVAAVAALIGGAPAGLTASSFVPVSLDPPLVSVCIARASTTWPGLRTAARLGISVLGYHQGAIGRQVSASGGERFAGLSWRATAQGAVLLPESSAWFDCSIEREIPAGDHDIVLLGVHDLGATAVMPLVFHGSTYRTLEAHAVSRGPDGRSNGGRDGAGSRSSGRNTRDQPEHARRCLLGS